jgi:hypothetical protein
MRQPSSCAPSPRDREQLLAHWVVDYGVFHPALHLAGDGHGELREAVHEIGGAVERVDDPEVSCCRWRRLLAGKRDPDACGGYR